MNKLLALAIIGSYALGTVVYLAIAGILPPLAGVAALGVFVGIMLLRDD